LAISASAGPRHSLWWLGRRVGAAAAGTLFGYWAAGQTSSAGLLGHIHWVYPLETVLCAALFFTGLSLFTPWGARLWWHLGWLPLVGFAICALPFLAGNVFGAFLAQPGLNILLWQGHMYNSPLGFSAVMGIALSATILVGLLPVPLRLAGLLVRLTLRLVKWAFREAGRGLRRLVRSPVVITRLTRRATRTAWSKRHHRYQGTHAPGRARSRP
jgi:hypothetical protein